MDREPPLCQERGCQKYCRISIRELSLCACGLIDKDDGVERQLRHLATWLACSPRFQGSLGHLRRATDASGAYCGFRPLLLVYSDRDLCLETVHVMVPRSTDVVSAAQMLCMLKTCAIQPCSTCVCTYGPVVSDEVGPGNGARKCGCYSQEQDSSKVL
ncbi:hypothetical protein GQ44DRAFT_206461 [Phaeosphaeriaceae sp. PMI808]|nr:hypothetical protein GQ44DRAFT_206461 [Phaeosphaeriaceae sp. PMI808]